MTRAVLWSQSARGVASLLARFDEVVVALDGPPAPSFAARWAHIRTQLPARAWCTPVPHTYTLATRFDRQAALPARVGAFDHLCIDDHEDAPAELPPAERALVVVRAQPFHRGHLALVEHALTLADEVVVVIAAAERSHAARDPFTAGERLAMVRAALGLLLARCWVGALPAPAWPAAALPELAFLAPPYQTVVAHNPVLIAMAQAHGKRVAQLPAMVRVAGEVLSASAIRARLVQEGAGDWLDATVPCAALLRTPSLAQRCAVIAAAG